VHSREHSDQNSDARTVGHDPAGSTRADGDTKDLREANENIRKARGEETMDTPVYAKRTGNRPRFDRDR
jgi:hypothetical protein